VGVDRVRACLDANKQGFPHTRGGGPDSVEHGIQWLQVFPTRVGVDLWSSLNFFRAIPVFPTRVGVDRLVAGYVTTLSEFSPHAWGWTDVRSPRRECSRVFPTRVGVDLLPTPSQGSLRRFPHTRGGGPFYKVWSGGEELVFPTRVGVDRQPRGWTRTRRCFPHTRGGGPTPEWSCGGTGSFSPHAWGWTALPGHGRGFQRVFPTRVGVDRRLSGVAGEPVRFPHTRGGGPSLHTLVRIGWAFSPHAWGWTGLYRT